MDRPRYVLNTTAFWVPLSLAAVAGAVAAPLSWRSLAEAAAFSLLVAALVRIQPLAQALRNGSLLHVLILAAFLGSAVLAHVGRLSVNSFPFITWRMFPGGEGPRPPQYLVMEGIRPDGRRIPVRGEALYPSLRYHRFQTTLRKKQARAEASQADRAVFDQLLEAVRRRHNQTRPESPVDSVVVRSVTEPRP